jgi:hypothetical protein
VKSPLPTITKAIVNKPTSNVLIKSKTHKAREEPLFEQTRLRQKINESKNSRARITDSRNIPNIPNSFATTKRASTSNRQLIRDPKHKEIWSTSAANEFGCLIQGVGGRVQGTNTIFFIQ